MLVIFHNQIDFIDRCIESILSQKVNFDYEIIIGDDSSDDGTWEEIQEYVKKYPKNITAYRVLIDKSLMYTNSQRSGINRANILKHAKGEYFNFIDGDDFIINEKRFQYQIDILEKNLDCIGCACGVSFYKEINGNLELDFINQDHLVLPSETKINSSFYIRNLFFNNMAIIFRNVYTNIYKDLEKTCFVDTYLTDYYLQYGDLYFINKPMYGYLLSQKGAWTGINESEKLVTVLYLSSVLLQTLNNFFMDICIKYKNEIIKCYNVKITELSPKYLQLVESNQKYLLMKLLSNSNLSLFEKTRLKLIYKLLNSLEKDNQSALREILLKFLINY